MARLYSNENFPLAVSEALRRLGHDVVTIQERGKGNAAATDGEVLDWATSEGRAVLTINRRDFIRLHAERPNHAGIIACTLDPKFEEQAVRIHEALQGIDPPNGQLVRVNRPA